MSYKVTISGNIILEQCIDHIAFSTANSRNSIIITGKVDTEESTVAIYKWSLLPPTNPECYKEITVEQYQKELLIRKVTFSRAFVIDYSESYSNSTGTGTFTLYVRQYFEKEIEVTSEETNKPVSNGVSDVKDKVVEAVEKVQQVAAIATPVLALTKKSTKITDKLAKIEEVQGIVKYGEHFTRKDRKKVLKPNIQYTTPEGYTYKTDELGRITSAEGTLQLGNGKRNADAQRKVGREDRKKDDDGGHLIASIFKGSGNYDNLVPMNGNLNKGEWKKLENDWAKALKAKPPKEVKVKVTPVYEGNSQRPVKFDIKYKIGNKWDTATLKNKPGGK